MDNQIDVEKCNEVLQELKKVLKSHKLDDLSNIFVAAELKSHQENLQQSHLMAISIFNAFKK